MSGVGRDVYAGDVDSSLKAASGDLSMFHYRIVADADPDVLVRISMILALSNVAPNRVTLLPISAGQVEITAQLPVHDRVTADYILRKIGQLTSVTEASVGTDST